MKEKNIKILISWIPLTFILLILLMVNLHKPLKTLVVQKESSETTLNFTSVTNPLYTLNILAPQQGTLAKIYKNYGDSVKTDDLLYNMKSPALETEFRQSVETYLKAKASHEKALFNFTGNSELYKLGLISKISWLDQESQLKDSEYAVLGAEQQVRKNLLTMGIPFEEVQKLSLSDIQKVKELFVTSLEGINIYAPESGILLFPSKTLGTSSEKESGALKPGAQITQGQTLGVIANMTGLILKITINEINFHDIHQGDTAEISSAAFEGIQLTGKVTAIDRQATGDDFNTVPSYVAYVKVPVLPEKARALIQVGMTAQIAIRQKTAPMIKIPLSAIRQNEGAWYVTVLDKDYEMHEVKVTPGSTDENSVEITEGLSEGDEIVLPD